MKRPHKTRAQSGFTLLEMLVVVAIFAIFAVLAYGGLNSVLKTRAAVERGQQELAQVQKAYLRLRDDFQQVQPRPVRDNYGDLQPAFYTNRDGDLELTRGGWRNPLLQPRSSLQRLSYHLGEDGLHRRSWRALDRAQDDQPQDLLLLPGVDKLSWRFLDEQAQWQSQWPPLNAVQGNTPETQLPAPPVAAEVTLRTSRFGELRFLFRLGLDPRRQETEPPSGLPPGPNPELPQALPRGENE